ncbi:MAG: mannose-1-phosphate guanylyltransferase/mannose-6-phosphate isomerase [Methylococcaceae bacterium]|nr:mannose-1-phosphate guanylyltransferase/mannose-6-phosphate isomerase [Methylococcaceae bacterium]
MYAVIMAGGSGTRFWPLSREKMPKQLLKIGGEDTLIQQTVDRVLPLIEQKNVFIVTNADLAVDIGTQLTARFGGSWDRNFILEPEAKNTAPALGLSALHLNRIDPDGIMIVLSADHAIRNVEAFRTCIATAAKAAAKDYLVTLGIKPNRPETGFGYIKAGQPCQEAGVDGVCRVERFVEKPDLATAQGYLASGHYYWNSGMFVWKVRTFLREIERHMPSLFVGLEQVRKSIGSGTETETIRGMFARLQSVSVDYGVMEKTDRAAVVPADIGWSDVGSWTALEEVTDKDASGNIIAGNVIDIDSTDSVIYADKRLVATIGLRDMIVVDTPDATLVCSRERAQDVKKVVDELKRRKAEERLTHRTVHRPWGNYTILEEGDRYKIKRIVVIPGAKLSHQLHHHRSEHWVVVSGTARVTNGDKEYDVHTNESTYIPMSTKHRLENPGRVPLQIIEVQNGEYLEEDDIVRFDDDYKRHESAKSPLPELPK